MMNKFILTALFLGQICFNPLKASGSSATPPMSYPFQRGENLKYQLRWLGIPLATTRLSVDGPLNWNGKRVFRFRAKLKSIGLLSRLYHVDDTAESHVNTRTLLSYRFDLRQKEGRYRAHRWNIFEQWRTVYGRKKRPPRYYETFGDLNDILSAFYKARSLSLQKGKEQDIYVFQGKHLYRVYLRVTGTESVDTLWGHMKTLVIQPRIEGKTRIGDWATTWIWVTADRLHIPVRVESRTYAGPVVLHLIESQGIPFGLLSNGPVRTLNTWKTKNMRVKEAAGGSASKIRTILEWSRRKSTLPKNSKKNPK